MNLVNRLWRRFWWWLFDPRLAFLGWRRHRRTGDLVKLYRIRHWFRIVDGIYGPFIYSVGEIRFRPPADDQMCGVLIPWEWTTRR